MKTFRELIFHFYKNKNNYRVQVKTPKPLYFKGVLVRDYTRNENGTYSSPTLEALVKSLRRSELGLLGKIKHFVVLNSS
jgi:hypothetical protein